MEKPEDVQKLYETWIEAWNNQNAKAMSETLSEDCNLIGFDGSVMVGREQVHKEIAEIFKHHPTGFFVSIIREIRFLSPTVATLRANVGMVPRDRSGLNPNVNAVQMAVAVEIKGKWFMSVFQNTPSALHGRPELVMKLTEELRAQAVKKGLLDARPSGPGH